MATVVMILPSIMVLAWTSIPPSRYHASSPSSYFFHQGRQHPTSSNGIHLRRLAVASPPPKYYPMAQATSPPASTMKHAISPPSSPPPPPPSPPGTEEEEDHKTGFVSGLASPPSDEARLKEMEFKLATVEKQLRRLEDLISRGGPKRGSKTMVINYDLGADASIDTV